MNAPVDEFTAIEARAWRDHLRRAQRCLEVIEKAHLCTATHDCADDAECDWDADDECLKEGRGCAVCEALIDFGRGKVRD